MKKEHIPYVLMCVLAVALAVLTFRVKELEGELRTTKANTNSEINRLRQDMSLIYNNVDDKMKKEASLFTNVTFTLGDLADGGVIPVTFEILPKTVGEDTEMTLTLGEKAVILQRDGDSFHGTVNVGIFESDITPLVTVISSVKQTEYLEDVNLSLLYQKLLPEFDADMAGGSTYNKKAKQLLVDHTFTVNDHAAASKDADFVRFTLVEEINGKEVSREDITDKVTSDGGSYFCDYKKSYDVETGDTLKIYVEAEDSLGYIHKRVAYYWSQNDSGATADVYYHGEAIYDKYGNMLVDNEYR